VPPTTLLLDPKAAGGKGFVEQDGADGKNQSRIKEARSQERERLAAAP